MLNIANLNDISADRASSAIETNMESNLEDVDINDITIENIIEDMIRNEETEKNKDNREDINVSENPLPEVLQSLDNNTEVGDFDLQRITNYSYKNSYLYLLYELKSGKTIPLSIEKLKQDFPLKTA